MRPGRVQKSGQSALLALEHQLLLAEGHDERAAEALRKALDLAEELNRADGPSARRLIPLLIRAGRLEDARAIWAPLNAAGYADPRLVRHLEEAGLLAF